MADFYWVGGGGDNNWSNGNNWSSIPGGAVKIGSAPTLTDDVYFGSTYVGDCVVNATANCLNLVFTEGTGYTGTLSGSSALNVYGSFTLVSGMTYSYTGTITFKATSAGFTITTAGKVFRSVTFNGVGGGWTLQDDFSTGGYVLNSTAGSVDFNEKTITCATFTGTATGVRTLDFSNCTINVEATWNCTTSANLTLTMTGSTLNIGTSTVAFTGGDKAYNIVNITGPNPTINSANSFNQLNITGTAVKTGKVTVSDTQIINASGVLSIVGDSVTNRLLVASNTLGTQRTIDCVGVGITVTISNCDLRDIDLGVAIDLSGATGGSGDCGGNDADITFTTPGTYYYNGAGNWSAGNWYTASGGGGSPGRVPLPQDTAKLDASSGNVTEDMPRIGSLDCTGYASTLSLGLANECYGSVTIPATATIGTPGYFRYLYGRGSHNLNIAVTNLINLTINANGGTYTLQNNLTMADGGIIELLSGTFTANNYNLTLPDFSLSGTKVRTLNMGSGTWELFDDNNSWYAATTTNLTFNCNTSTIKLTSNSSTASNFVGGDLTYYKLWIATAGTGATVISGSNTFNEIEIDPGRTVNFTSSTTQTVTTFVANGTGALPIILQASGAANWVLNCTAGTIDVYHCTITKSTAQGGATFNANDSTDSGTPPNSGWNFLTTSTFLPRSIIIW